MSGLRGLVTLDETLQNQNTRLLFGDNPPPLKTFQYTESDPLRIMGNEYKSNVQRHGDLVKPIALSVKVHNPGPIHIDRIDVKIGGFVVNTIPFSIFKALSEEQLGTTRIYKCDFNKFMEEIPLIRLGFHEVWFVVHVTSHDNIDEMRFLYEYTFLNTVERRSLAHVQNYTQPIQFFQTIEVNNPDALTRFKVQTNFNNLCKGYIIEGPVERINRLGYYLNGHETFNYRKPIIDTLCKTLSHNLLYVPLNAQERLESNNILSFQGGINHNRIDNVSFGFELTGGGPSQFAIHAVNANILRTCQGLGGALFHIDQKSVSPAVTQWIEEPTQNLLPAQQQPPIAWTLETKRINPNKSFCAIMYDEIKEGATYCECDKCKNCFDADSLKQNFQTALRKKCPMCREMWTTWIIYTNKDE
jgi:hypothetical protein